MGGYINTVAFEAVLYSILGGGGEDDIILDSIAEGVGGLQHGQTFHK